LISGPSGVNISLISFKEKPALRPNEIKASRSMTLASIYPCQAKSIA
jgi:hypothetical protein